MHINVMHKNIYITTIPVNFLVESPSPSIGFSFSVWLLCFFDGYCASLMDIRFCSWMIIDWSAAKDIRREKKYTLPLLYSLCFKSFVFIKVFVFLHLF